MTAPAEPEHLDVVIVGAGLSGIDAGHHLRTTAPWASYTILEARDAILGEQPDHALEASPGLVDEPHT